MYENTHFLLHCIWQVVQLSMWEFFQAIYVSVFVHTNRGSGNRVLVLGLFTELKHVAQPWPPQRTATYLTSQLSAFLLNFYNNIIFYSQTPKLNLLQYLYFIFHFNTYFIIILFCFLILKYKNLVIWDFELCHTLL